ncbi:MAG TPA: penicillin-binding transpeptidase domain-containing protein [Clostridiaceae bacterium]
MSLITTKKRIYLIFTLFFIIFLLLIYKLKLIAMDNSTIYTSEAESQYTYGEKLSDINYDILDCKGRSLIKFIDKFNCVIIPATYRMFNADTDRETLLKFQYILKTYNKDYDVDNVINNKNSSTNQKLYFSIDEDTYNKLKAVDGVKGTYLYKYEQSDQSEAYNIITLLLSSKKDTSIGTGSLQNEIKENVKNNTPGTENFTKSNDGIISLDKIDKSKKNMNVKLTVDKDINDEIKSILTEDKYSGFEQVGAVLMESSTGKIKAIAQRDDTLPNVNLGSSTINGYYPGSIFKVIVEEAGLEEGKISTDQIFTCNTNTASSLCQENHGTIPVSDALVDSCNNIFAQVGNIVGYKNFIANAENQGIFNRVLNINTEVKGDYVKPIDNAGGSRLISIGQNMQITPLQAISIPNTVVNEGIYVKPYIVDAYVDDSNNQILTKDNKTNRAISKTTADKLKTQMLDVVKKGTAIQAISDQIIIGGKTGTTERNENNKKYSDGWFVGFFTVKNINYSMVVFVKNIDVVTESGGSTATPIFKEIVEKLNSIL